MNDEASILYKTEVDGKVSGYKEDVDRVHNLLMEPFLPIERPSDISNKFDIEQIESSLSKARDLLSSIDISRLEEVPEPFHSSSPNNADSRAEKALKAQRKVRHAIKEFHSTIKGLGYIGISEHIYEGVKVDSWLHPSIYEKYKKSFKDPSFNGYISSVIDEDIMVNLLEDNGLLIVDVEAKYIYP